MRYKFYTNPEARTVVCVSTFAGRRVRGVAKCDPTDTFDKDKGKMLAKLRCDYKIAKKRKKRAIEKYNDAYDAYIKAGDYVDAMGLYFADAQIEYDNLQKSLKEFESEL